MAAADQFGPQAAHQSRGGGGVMRRMRIEMPFGGARRPHFTVQPAQTFPIVNIVPRRQHVHFQLKFTRPFQRLRGNALGAQVISSNRRR
jgi:hypothetical protein